MTPELRWLSDPTVFAVNRLDAHSDHLCCRTLDEAESGLTSLRQSLDGAWRFAWSANPAAAGGFLAAGRRPVRLRYDPRARAH